eukprot:m.20481 g.20481  ORF g.20481 m.20481 type:complete len:414 (-) comp6860_c0_seq1:140-1381(-)
MSIINNNGVFVLFVLAPLIIAERPKLKFGPQPAVDRLDALYEPIDQWDPKIEPLSDDRFGFYIHAFSAPSSVMYMVERLSKVFPTCPVYIMSDGGMDFTDLCALYNCTFKLCPPANDRWHPWPFLRRFWDAAVHLNREYVIMLEPDNTVHHKIYAHPHHDAGGLRDANPGFGHLMTGYIEGIGKKHRDFNWTYIQSGLAGGAYFRTAAVLDAFSDAAIASLNWTMIEALDTKRVFSSDFSMPIVLSARGYTYGPWRDIGQYDLRGNDVTNQPRWAAIQHYGRGVAGGKPTYNLQVAEEFKNLAKQGRFGKSSNNCQRCYTLEDYRKKWGSLDCTNRLAEGYTGTPPTGEEVQAMKKQVTEMLGGPAAYSKYIKDRNQRVADETALRRKRYLELDEKLYNGPDTYVWTPKPKTN